MAKQTKPVPAAPRQPRTQNLGTQTVVVDNITVAQLNRGNQTIQTWITNVKAAESLLTPYRRPLYDTFLDISIDGFVDSLMDKRTRALKITPFEWVGLDNDKAKENLQGPWFQKMLGLFGKRIFWGVTLAEFKLDGGLIADVDQVPYQNVKSEKGVIMKDGYSDDAGSSIFYREGIYQNYILQVGEDRELGKLANIAGYILLKRQNFGDFARYNEMFGMDLRVYRYNPAKPGARAEAERSAKEYGSAAYIVLPDGNASVEFVGSNKQSSALAYDKLLEVLNREITIAILGQSLTTGGEGGGSYELGKVHLQVQNEIAIEDRLTAEYIINYPFKNNILLPHGYPVQNAKGVFRVPDELPKELKANMWIMLAKAGLPIAEEDFYTEFGVPLPGSRPIIVAPVGNFPDPNNIDPAAGNDPNPPQPPQPKPAGGAGKKKP